MTTKLFCGTCGAMMVGESGTSSSKGRKYHYYRCVNTKQYKTCSAKHKSIKKLPIERALVNSVLLKGMDDKFNDSTKQRLYELEERKKDIELQIIQKEMKHSPLSREDVTFWICRFRTLDVSKLEKRRRRINPFVNSVTIFDEYILITFNYKEGETRLNFGQIDSPLWVACLSTALPVIHHFCLLYILLRIVSMKYDANWKRISRRLCPM